MINIFTDYLVRALANIFISDFMMILSSLFNARMEFFVLKDLHLYDVIFNFLVNKLSS